MPRPSHVYCPPTMAAQACAHAAYARRVTCFAGIMYTDAEGRRVIVLFDNEMPGGTMRNREWVPESFDELLDDAGFRILATATYPRSGLDDGQSLAVVLDAPPGDEREVLAAWKNAVDGSPFIFDDKEY